jgi:hypothetical protein
MKLLIVAFVALLCAACSSNAPTSPSTTVSTTAAVVQTSGDPVTPTETTEPSLQLDWHVIGPYDSAFQPIVVPIVNGVPCIGPSEVARLLSHELLWDVVVRNAGARGIHGFRKLVFHDDQAGCEPTFANGRDRIQHIGGPIAYLPHESGTTRFTAPASFDGARCGRNQYDVDIEDGNGLTTIIPLLVNFGENCLPPALTCPSPDQILVGGRAEWSWSPGDAGVRVAFTVRPDLPAPVRLTLASYEITTPTLFPQTLRSETQRVVDPGQRVEMFAALPANVCSAQLDLLTCADAPKILTEAIDTAEIHPFLIDYWWPPAPCGQWFRR